MADAAPVLASHQISARFVGVATEGSAFVGSTSASKARSRRWRRCSLRRSRLAYRSRIHSATGAWRLPLALLFLANRVLNPALVLIEVPLNAYVLWVNRDALPDVWRRIFPMVIGLVPGIVAGTLMVSKLSPDWLKLLTFVVLLPLILLQAAGIRRPGDGGVRRVTVERSL